MLQISPGIEQFDIVLLGNILHYFPPDQMQALLRKAHKALKPGGLW